jgi:CelD/BcsL family acetyltransferase involved in cellulose biosynthesis
MVRENTASIIGSPDVCDYLDFIVAPGEESDFCAALLNKLKSRGVKVLAISQARGDSVIVNGLAGLADIAGCGVNCESADVTVELDLPATWEEYLGMLTAKQRHEVERKLRRLERADTARLRIIKDQELVPGFMATFLDLFPKSRKDKAMFMTDKMKSFFRKLADNLTAAGLFRGAVLELGSVPVATLFGFDYNNILYLYNSAYDPQFSSLSVGILSKALFIRDSIREGKRRFDFLKGDERYKFHLGGKDTPLFNCRIEIG